MTSIKTIAYTSDNSNNGNPSNSDKTPKYKEAFFIVPRYIIEMEGITLAYIKVYETIFQFWNKGLNCFLKEGSLLERTGVKRSQLYEALKFFEANNQLVRRTINGKRYLVQPERIIETDIAQESPPEKLSTPVRQSGRDPSGRADYTRPVERTHNIKKINKENKQQADDVLITKKCNSMGATPRETETVQRKIRAKRQKGDEITSVEGLAGHIVTGLRKGTQKFYEGSQRQHAKPDSDSYHGVPKRYIEKHARPGESYESAAGRLRDSYFSQPL